MTATQVDLFSRGSALFSQCRRYRYELTRRWRAGPPCVFLMLNPSTATEVDNDPTVRRAIAFAHRWGYPALTVLNLFALRSTDPRGLLTVDDPIGPDNDEIIRRVCRSSDAVVCAWGVHGRLGGRDVAVLDLLAGDLEVPLLECLGTTLDGDPKHPLYLRNDAERTPYPGKPG